MNADKILELADFIESSSSPFDMSRWKTCAFGYAVKLWSPGAKNWEKNWEKTREILGLDDQEFRALSGMDGMLEDYLKLKKLTREGAVAALRDYAHTGFLNYMKHV